MSGCFIVPRGWMGDFKPERFTEREAFLWSIEHAACAPGSRLISGTPVTVERGQIATSVVEMAKAFDWSTTRVRGFIGRMVKARMWCTRLIGPAVVISIQGFDDLVPPARGLLQ